LITRPEESYRLWCVDVCDLKKYNPRNEDEGQDPLRGYRAKRKKNNINALFITEMESVYSAVRTESLYSTDTFRL